MDTRGWRAAFTPSRGSVIHTAVPLPTNPESSTDEHVVSKQHVYFYPSAALGLWMGYTDHPYPWFPAPLISP